MWIIIDVVHLESGFKFVRFFGGCIQANVRNFELNNFLVALGNFFKE